MRRRRQVQVGDIGIGKIGFLSMQSSAVTKVFEGLFAYTVARHACESTHWRTTPSPDLCWDPREDVGVGGNGEDRKERVVGTSLTNVSKRCAKCWRLALIEPPPPCPFPRLDALLKASLASAATSQELPRPRPNVEPVAVKTNRPKRPRTSDRGVGFRLHDRHFWRPSLSAGVDSTVRRSPRRGQEAARHGVQGA